MRRFWSAVTLVLLAGCGVAPSAVTDAGVPPTGVAPGVTLFFLDGDGGLVPEVRETGRLGTIAEALALLLAGPGGGFGGRDQSGRTGIAPAPVTRVTVTMTPGGIELRMPVSGTEITPVGIDQIVCTALGVHIQAGGSPATTVRVVLSNRAAPGSDAPRTCPVFR